MSSKTKHVKTRKPLTGEQLAYYRKVAGMTQHEVAQETGISFHRLAYAETDRLTLNRKEEDILIRLYKLGIDRAVAAVKFLRGLQ